jgi:hypothetical protein
MEGYGGKNEIIAIKVSSLELAAESSFALCQ